VAGGYYYRAGPSFNRTMHYSMIRQAVEGAAI
jgi:hypothetical protein